MYLALSFHDSQARWKIVGINLLASLVATVLFKLAEYALSQAPSFTNLPKHLPFSYVDRSTVLVA